jgi:GrpB-like predicted nucleotidyltransferase (UPF0157 family)
VLVVADAAHEAEYAPALGTSGYGLRLREPSRYEHRLFTKREPAVNLHIFSVSCPEIARMTMFRDWLRHSASDRTRYEATKRTLADHPWQVVQDYADEKTSVVTEILPRATRWSEAGRPGASS